MQLVARRIGMLLAVAHFMLFVASAAYVYRSIDGQASLLWVVWAIIDFPISLLYVAFAEQYSQWLGGVMNQHEVLQQILYLPHVVHGLLGAIWWYLLPRLVTPKRFGGVWGRLH